jgi:hypothetical protein
MGIIIPILYASGYPNILPFLFGMYGIPAIYGMIIGLTNSDILPMPLDDNINQTSSSLVSIIKKSCTENTQSLIILGGYIIFTNACRILLDFMPIKVVYKDVISAFIELTGGVQTIYTASLSNEFKIFWIMTSLSFGGISCFMQTSCFLEKSNLSTNNYMKHKFITTFISAIYYIIILS